jgi:eukaryotic-like serine/threonine-protein kinase
MSQAIVAAIVGSGWQGHRRCGVAVSSTRENVAETDDKGLGTGETVAVSEIEATLTAPSGLEATVGSLPPPAPQTASPPSPALVEGAKIDRFLVVEKLGEGGMGVVLAAYDPMLDRKVALKLLRPKARSSVSLDEASARMLREAQAMARLSHPNVITVYEVGTVGDQVFIAMEFVPGATLTRWLAQAPRTEREIVAAFAAAGRGLAAAHAAGLIHRDFKPDNAIVGADHRLRVLDFGLARAAVVGDGDGAAAVPDGAVSPTSSASELRTPLTVAGAVMGTPAYMAPEQHRGQEVDARADQFNFCVALYEALYKQRPFPGKTLAELAAAVTTGRPREPPADSTVPGWLRKVIARGLASDPAARYPSMTALVDELERDPRAARRRLAAAAAVAVVFLGGLTAMWVARGGGQPSQACTGGPGKLAEVWSPATRARLDAAFAASGAGHATDAAAHTAGLLDDYGAGWVSMYTEACEATRVRGEQSAGMLDLRMRCLDDRRGKLAALVDLLATAPDRELVAKAVEATRAALPAVDRCGDLEALTAQVPPPDDPEVQAALDAVTPALDRANALQAAGKWAPALAEVDAVVATIRDTQWKPAVARALFTRGDLLRLSGDPGAAVAPLEEAAQLGAEAGDRELVARAWTVLVVVRGLGLGDHADALAMEPYARAAVALAGGGDELVGDLATMIGLVHLQAGALDQALEHLERALASRRRRHGPDHHSVGETLSNLGAVYQAKGELERARQLFLESLTVREQALGAGHPEVGSTLINLGWVEQSLGNGDAALAHLTRAIELVERTAGPDHPNLAVALQNVAAIHGARGDYQRALAPLQRSLAIREQQLGADHVEVADALVGLGAVAQATGDPAYARQLQERALAIYEHKLGAEHPRASYALLNLGMIAHGERKHDEALGHLERALRVLTASLGDDHPLVARTLWTLGELHAEMGQHAKAVDHHGRAIGIYDRVGGSDHPDKAGPLLGLGVARLGLGQARQALPPLRDAVRVAADPRIGALARYHLARAIWATERDAAEARSLAEAARAVLQDHAAMHERELAAIGQFLATLK